MMPGYTVINKQKKWDSLEKYLSYVQNNIPDAGLNLCDNTAVDSVAGYYGLLYRKQGIPFSFKLDLPCENGVFCANVILRSGT